MTHRPMAWIAVLSVAATALAQTEHDPAQHHSPYAGQEPSGIAALSARELSDLREGAGMGLARAAELNHYPGPRHVLELAAELALTDEQRAGIESIHSGMLERAKSLGAQIIEKESELDRRFAHRHLDDETLHRILLELGRLEAELRFVHLSAHLTTTALLTEEQIRSYDRARGYEGR